MWLFIPPLRIPRGEIPLLDIPLERPLFIPLGEVPRIILGRPDENTTGVLEPLPRPPLPL